MTRPLDPEPFLSRAGHALAFPVTRLFSLDDPLGLPWLLCGLVFIILSWRVARGRQGRPGVRLRSVWRWLFPRRVLWHPSSRLDYKLFVVNSVVVTGVVSLLVTGPQVWKGLVTSVLVQILGPASPPLMHPGVLLIGGAALASLVALDLGYWLAHLAMHRLPLLWEFHKVHHSAEVMTPATEWRQHPVEFLLFPTVYGLTTGLVYGGLAYGFGEEAQGQAMTVQNLLIVVHLATFHHVRHSHIKIPFTGAWGRLLHSPAHHQLHHSADPAHHDCNLGYLLSVWDWWAGTLILPTGRERLTLGIGEEGRHHDSVRAVYLRPVVAVCKMVSAIFLRKVRPDRFSQP